MSRLNIVLLAVLVVCALATVTSTHQARKLFVELERARAEHKRIEVEWGQLQLEQSTWAKHAHIEAIASKSLAMRLPDARRLQFITPAPPAEAPR
ncbi:MAG: cell division protein FtsL [Burkholderiales bacterium]|nr:cell division protein FtsL [Burkholderiales bacterium]